MMGPIEVHIHLHGDKEILPEKKADSSEADALLVRLMNKDSLDDQGLMQLTGEVVEFVGKKKAAGDMSCIKRFLSEENRAMMTPEMKELISEKLNPTI